MSTHRILDTWDDFLRFWRAAADLPLPAQVDLWRTAYMARYPALLRKQVEDYDSQGVDWRQVAAERIFPALPQRLPRMEAARDLLPHICASIYERAQAALGLDFDVVFVIYVGLGCGAGWATQYEGQPACLLGLENVAEEGWHTRERLEGLVAHELGHLAHMAWRGEWEEFAEHERDPLFLLYSEGFAVRCEEAILGGAGHLAQDGEWLAWCAAHRQTLAAEFLRRVENGEAVRDFFGSWYEAQGHSQTGYYLGRELVGDLGRGRALRDVARMSVGEVRKAARAFLHAALP
ncbi:MAG: hypothetical protein Kow00123_17800 [Anaerolineales bacterium]